MYSSVYPQAVEALQEAHRQDPNLEPDGTPSELKYSERLAAGLAQIYPDASEALAIAVWCQHLHRWEIARNSYPEGKMGYYQWRNYLGEYQAEKAAAILCEAGYDDAFVAQVTAIVKKLNINNLEDAQKLEDVVCLVFLQHYMSDFMADKQDAQLIHIVQKTWGKMSEHAHQLALKADLPASVARIVKMALA